MGTLLKLLRSKSRKDKGGGKAEGEAEADEEGEEGVFGEIMQDPEFLSQISNFIITDTQIRSAFKVLHEQNVRGTVKQVLERLSTQ